MYKTIRHGENSLQYTILPQNDDFRIEGKLSGNGRSSGGASSSSGSASSSSGAKVKGQRRRRSFFAYLGLIFVCTVIIGAVLIPFLVSAECLPNPTEWFLKTKAALIHSPQRGGGGGGGIVSAGGDMTGNPTLPTGSPLLQQNVGRNVQIVNRNGVEQFVIRLNKTTLSNLASTTTTTSSSSTTTTTSTTTTPAPTTTTTSSTSTTTTTTTTREPVTTPRYLPPATTITTRIIQVPLLKSAAKKPIMPPVLAKAQGAQYQPGVGQQDAKMQTQSNQAEEQAAAVQNNRSNSAWLKTNWAYIDPSTYFQWTGYKAEDSVLLPALLGFALIGVILIITVCLVARNKRTIVSSVRKRNRNHLLKHLLSCSCSCHSAMAIKPGLGRKTSNKNPPILSHEFVIQNHADIISCVAMVFVVGLMNESTAAFASAFISLHHNVSGEDPSREQPYGKAYTYIAGIKDYCAIFFYTLTCIIMHAIIQEFVLDKISKKLHLSKFKLARFNESGQLVAFYLLSFVWGAHVVLKEGYLGQVAQLWEGFPDHPMSFLHKFYFIVQLAYYLHMLPELYFQKIKTKEEQQPKIIHSISGFTLIVLAYTLSFQRLALVLLTLHYFSELLSHVFQLIGVFDREERLAKLRVVNNGVFFLIRFATSVIGVLTLHYGIGGFRSLLALGGLIALQGYLVFSFITEQLRAKREAKKEAKREAKLALQTKKPSKAPKDKVKRKKESDLPEADQSSPSPVKQKLK